MKRGSYQLAKRCFFLDAIDFDKTLSEPHHNVGRLYLLEERYHGAAEELARAAELSPDDAAIRMRLGQAHAGLMLYDKAMKEFDAAIGLDPEYTPAYLEKAKVLYSQQNYAEGAAACREALLHIPPYVPPVSAKQNQSNISMIDKLLPGQKIVEDDSPPPTYKEEASYDLALCLKAQGQYGEALTALVGADTAKDGNADVQILRARLQDLMGDTGGALVTLGLLRGKRPSRTWRKCRN